MTTRGGADMDTLMLGAIAMGFAVAGVFFLRFWRETGDRLFGMFALAFFILAAGRVVIAMTRNDSGRGEHLYWIRFVSFVVILLAIWDKNRARRRKP